MARTNSEAGQEIQMKLNFYVIALVFTVLGLSVQTADFGTSTIADILEMLAWFLLLVSGLTGLKRLEMVPKLLRMYDHDALKQESQETNKRILRWYQVHRTTFAAGFMLLVIARAYLPLKGIIERLAT